LEPPIKRTTSPTFQLTLIIVGQCIPPFLFSSVAVLLPDLGKDLGVGALYLNLFETVFLMGQLVFLFPAGILANGNAKELLYSISLGTLAIACVGVSLTTSPALLLAFRALQGMNAAMVSVLGPSLINDLVVPEKRGRALGAWLGSIYAGLTLGPLIGGLITYNFHWRGVFWFGAGLLALASNAARTLPRRQEGKAAQLSYRHALPLLLLAGSTATFFSAMSSITKPFQATVLACGSLIMAFLFYSLQKRVTPRLIDNSLLIKNTPLKIALFTQWLIYLNAFAYMFLLSLFLQRVLHYSPQQTGIVIGVSTFFMALSAPFAGRLSDTFSPRAVLPFGIFFITCGSALGITLQLTSSVTLVIGILSLKSIGFGFFSSPNMSIVMKSVDRAHSGTASSLAAIARSVGMVSGMTGIALLTSLVSSEAIDALNPSKLVIVTQWAFIFFFISSLVALSLCTRKGEDKIQKS
jgi:MFS family permease